MTRLKIKLKVPLSYISKTTGLEVSVNEIEITEPRISQIQKLSGSDILFDFGGAYVDLVRENNTNKNLLDSDIDKFSLLNLFGLMAAIHNFCKGL